MLSKLFSYLSLRAFNISGQRKSVFVTTLVFLVVLFSLRQFGLEPFGSIPYATKIISVIILTLVVNLFSSIVRFFVVTAYRNRQNLSGEDHDNFTVGANAIVTSTTLLAALVSFFIVFKIQLQEFLTSIALFSFALAVLFQEFIKSFLHGLILMFSNDYRIGDYVQVGSFPKGIIRTITFSETKIRTDDGNMLIIPNHVVRSSEVINFSKTRYKRITTSFFMKREQVGSLSMFERALVAHIQDIFSEHVQKEKMFLRVKETNVDGIVLSLEASVSAYSFNLEDKIKKSIFSFVLEYTPQLPKAK